MRLSQLFTKTLREAPADEIAVNARYLTRGGFVFKNSAGIYSFLPLGWRVMGKIMNIVREEIHGADRKMGLKRRIFREGENRRRAGFCSGLVARRSSDLDCRQVCKFI